MTFSINKTEFNGIPLLVNYIPGLARVQDCGRELLTSEHVLVGLLYLVENVEPDRSFKYALVAAGKNRVRCKRK